MNCKIIYLLLMLILILGGCSDKSIPQYAEPENIDELAKDIESWSLGDFKLEKKVQTANAYRFNLAIPEEGSIEAMFLYDSSDDVKSAIKPCDWVDGKVKGMPKGTIEIAGIGKGDLYSTYDNIEVYFGSPRRGFDVPTYFWCNSFKTVLIVVSVSPKLVEKYFQFYGLTQEELTFIERDTQRKADLAIIQHILHGYASERGIDALPTNEVIKIDDLNNWFNKELNNFLGTDKLLSAIFGNSIPRDPLSPEYYYGFGYYGENYRTVDGKWIKLVLTANLENKDDPDCIMENQVCLYKIIK